ncbi:hypothetical protein ACC791_37720, partial [Rhizobium ruizarguesonis]
HRDDASEDQRQARSGGEDAEPDAEETAAAPERRTPMMIDAEPSAYQPGAAADPVRRRFLRRRARHPRHLTAPAADPR